MLRCGQMLLATCLQRIHLSRNWRWKKETTDQNYLKIVSRFEDVRTAPFGLHQIVLMGEDSGKQIGDWWGPSTIGQVLKKLVRFDDFSNLCISVALDHQLATEEVLELQTSSETFTPVLIIVPLRLGLSELNQIYIDGLKKVLEMKSTVGIIGGRPNQALYFFGYVDDEILFLDPHTCQRSGSVGEKETKTEIEIDETYHNRSAGKMAFTSMDPSIAVSFLCETREEFDDLIQQIEAKDGKTPLFEVIKSRAAPWVSASSSMSSSRDLEQDLNVICGEQTQEEFEEVIKEEGSEDEFEIIE
jgi:cysteine protease ATG4